jgi:hypothetical protein
VTTRSAVKRGVLGGSSGGSPAGTRLPALDSRATGESHPATSATLTADGAKPKAFFVTGTCTGCAADAVFDADYCERHLRGMALALLDRALWPRFQLKAGNTVTGDDAWRPWLREAKAEQLREVVDALWSSRSRRFA